MQKKYRQLLKFYFIKKQFDDWRRRFFLGLLLAIILPKCSGTPPKKQNEDQVPIQLIKESNRETKKLFTNDPEYAKRVKELENLPELETAPEYSPYIEATEAFLARYYQNDGLDLCPFLGGNLDWENAVESQFESSPATQPDHCSIPTENVQIDFKSLILTVESIFDLLTVENSDQIRTLHTNLDFKLKFSSYTNGLMPDLAGEIKIRLLLTIGISENNLTLSIDDLSDIESIDGGENKTSFFPLLKSGLATIISDYLEQERTLTLADDSEPTGGVFQLIRFIYNQTESFNKKEQYTKFFAELNQLYKKIKSNLMATQQGSPLAKKIYPQTHPAPRQDVRDLLHLDLCKTSLTCQPDDQFFVTPQSLEGIYFENLGEQKKFIIPLVFNGKFNVTPKQIEQSVSGNIEFKIIFSGELSKNHLEWKILDAYVIDFQLDNRSFSSIKPILITLANYYLIKFTIEKSQDQSWFQSFLGSGIKEEKLWPLLSEITTQDQVEAIISEIPLLTSIYAKNTFPQEPYASFFNKITKEKLTRKNKIFDTFAAVENSGGTNFQTSFLLPALEFYLSHVPIDLTQWIATQTDPLNDFKINRFLLASLDIHHIHSRLTPDHKKLFIPASLGFDFDFFYKDEKIASHWTLEFLLVLDLQQSLIQINVAYARINAGDSNHPILSGLNPVLQNLLNQHLQGFIAPQISTLNTYLKSASKINRVVWELLNGFKDETELDQIVTMLNSLRGKILAKPFSSLKGTEKDRRLTGYVSTISPEFARLLDKNVLALESLTPPEKTSLEPANPLPHLGNLQPDLSNLCFLVPDDSIITFKSCQITPTVSPTHFYALRDTKKIRILLPVHIELDFDLSRFVINLDLKGKARVDTVIEIEITPQGTKLDFLSLNVPSLDLTHEYLGPFSDIIRSWINDRTIFLLKKIQPEISSALTESLNKKQVNLWNYLKPLNDSIELEDFIRSGIRLWMLATASQENKYIDHFPLNRSYHNLRSKFQADIVIKSQKFGLFTPKSIPSLFSSSEGLFQTIIRSFFDSRLIDISHLINIDHIGQGINSVQINKFSILPNLDIPKIYYNKEKEKQHFLIPLSFYVAFDVDRLLLNTNVAADAYINFYVMVSFSQGNISITPKRLEVKSINFKNPLLQDLNGLWQNLLNTLLGPLVNKPMHLAIIAPLITDELMHILYPTIQTLHTQEKVDVFVNAYQKLVADLKRQLTFPAEDPTTSEPISRVEFSPHPGEAETAEKIFEQHPTGSDHQNDEDFFDYQGIQSALKQFVVAFHDPTKRTAIDVCRVLSDEKSDTCVFRGQSGSSYIFSHFNILFLGALQSLIQNIEFSQENDTKTIRFDLVARFNFLIRDAYIYFDLNGEGTANLPIEISFKPKQSVDLNMGNITISNWITSGIFNISNQLSGYTRDTVLEKLNQLDKNNLINQANLGIITEILSIALKHVRSTVELRQYLKSMQHLILQLHRDLERSPGKTGSP